MVLTAYKDLNLGHDQEKLGHKQKKLGHHIFEKKYKTENCLATKMKFGKKIVRPLKVRTKTAFKKNLGHAKFGLVTLHRNLKCMFLMAFKYF